MENAIRMWKYFRENIQEVFLKDGVILNGTTFLFFVEKIGQR